ncbi:glycosyltransferase [Alkalibaculum bacchi]|uniref:glycosyltransferase n=1 Tax=Alkalibaculum bacchi TaxID=645887 RepID=UPI0026F17664|nr:glycosyltransferase [Alkalibaculum bacchi]
MRVLIISNMYPTKDKPQFGIFVYNQVMELEKMGYECKVISLQSKGNKYLRYLTFLVKGLFYSLIKGGSYHIVHAHYAFPPGIFATLHKKRYGSKMIITAHGSDINKMPNKSPLIKKEIQKIIRESHKVICVSEELKHKILDWKIQEEKIQVINMGVNGSIFCKMDKEKVKHELGLPFDKFVVLFVGNFYKAKGILDLLEAFKKALIPSKMLLLVGDPNVETKTTEQIHSGLEENIRVIPPQSQQEVAKYMNACDVFVLPSYTEGFNLVTLEAMATETLVVTSDIEAFEYLEENTVIKSKTGDVEDLARRLEMAYGLTAEEKEAYIANGWKVAQENSAQEKAKKVGIIYEELFNERIIS